jgi:hypothetical protein
VADGVLVFRRWEQVKVTEQILPLVREQLRPQEGRDAEFRAGLIGQSFQGATSS